MTKQGYRPGTVGLVSAVGAMILAAGCTDYPDGEHTYNTVCTIESTEIRVDDSQCAPGYDDGDSSTSFIWFYMIDGSHAPPVGQRVTNGSKVIPVGSGAHNTQYGGVNPKGGPVLRGNIVPKASDGLVYRGTQGVQQAKGNPAISRGGFGVGGAKGSAGS